MSWLFVVYGRENNQAVQKNVPLFEQETEKIMSGGARNAEKIEVANFVEFIMKFVRQLENPKTLITFCSDN